MLRYLVLINIQHNRLRQKSFLCLIQKSIKKKKKDAHAGLMIPQSMLCKNSAPAMKPKPKSSFAGNAGLLKMLKTGEVEKKDKLKTFFNV